MKMDIRGEERKQQRKDAINSKDEKKQERIQKGEELGSLGENHQKRMD